MSAFVITGTDSWYNSDEVSSDALDQVLDLVIEVSLSSFTTFSLYAFPDKCGATLADN
jgi:hypothetical protein